MASRGVIEFVFCELTSFRLSLSPRQRRDTSNCLRAQQVAGQDLAQAPRRPCKTTAQTRAQMHNANGAPERTMINDTTRPAGVEDELSLERRQRLPRRTREISISCTRLHLTGAVFLRFPEKSSARTARVTYLIASQSLAGAAAAARSVSQGPARDKGKKMDLCPMQLGRRHVALEFRSTALLNSRPARHQQTAR